MPRSHTSLRHSVRRRGWLYRTGQWLKRYGFVIAALAIIAVSILEKYSPLPSSADAPATTSVAQVATDGPARLLFLPSSLNLITNQHDLLGLLVYLPDDSVTKLIVRLPQRDDELSASHFQTAEADDLTLQLVDQTLTVGPKNSQTFASGQHLLGSWIIDSGNTAKTETLDIAADTVDFMTASGSVQHPPDQTSAIVTVSALQSLNWHHFLPFFIPTAQAADNSTVPTVSASSGQSSVFGFLPSRLAGVQFDPGMAAVLWLLVIGAGILIVFGLISLTRRGKADLTAVQSTPYFKTFAALNPAGYQLSTYFVPVRVTPESKTVPVGQIGYLRLTVENNLAVPLKQAMLRIPLPSGYETALSEIEVAGETSNGPYLDKGTVIIPLGLILPKQHRQVRFPLVRHGHDLNDHLVIQSSLHFPQVHAH